MLMTTGQRIIERRRLCGLSQKQIAEALSVSVQAVSQWEADKSQPKSDRVGHLASILGVTSSWLLGMVDELPRPYPVQRETGGEVVVVDLNHALLHYIRGLIIPEKHVVDRVHLTHKPMGLGFAVRYSSENENVFGFITGDYLIFDSGVFPIHDDVVLRLPERSRHDKVLADEGYPLSVEVVSGAEHIREMAGGVFLGTLVERRTFRPIVNAEGGVTGESSLD